MRLPLTLALALATTPLFAQQPSRSPNRAPDWQNPPRETQALFPVETSPGRYRHVSPENIQALAGAGWELVSVVPYVYMNEERGPKPSDRPLVTQIYLAYFLQRERKYGNLYPPYEVTTLFPREGPPAMYTQVNPAEVQRLTAQGWELVGVAPYVIKNEERGPEPSNRPLVTQTYPAYFLRRIVLQGARSDER